MIRSRGLRLSGGRLATAIAVAAVVLLATTGTALAGPLPPITPVFPPWVYGGLTMSLPATVTGTVMSGSSPVAGVVVEISGSTSSTAPEAQSFTQRATTGADGHFVITDVIQGTYQMIVNDQNASPTVAAYREQSPWYDWTYTGTGTDTRHQVMGGTTVDAGTINLVHNGVVTVHARRGATAVADVPVAAVITDGDETFYRWARTNASGDFTISNAPPGDWSVTYSGVGQNVPADAVPGGSNDADPRVITQSVPDTFSLAPSEVLDLTAHQFVLGGSVYTAPTEYHAAQSTSFNLSGISVSAVLNSDTSKIYTWQTDDKGHATPYLPVGSYTVTLSDPTLALYADKPGIALLVSTSGTSIVTTMAPAAGTHLIYGRVSEQGAPGSSLATWVMSTYLDPSGWAQWSHRVLSNGASGPTAGQYAIRVPNDTGLAGISGNQIRLDWDDQTADVYPGTNHPDGPTHVTFSHSFPSTTSDVLYNVTDMALGGRITGTVHDELGNPVVGVSVSAERVAYDAETGQMQWMNSVLPNSASWWTLTDSSGHYTLGGLPATSDYRVTFNPDYNPAPWPLPIHYEQYYRAVWRNRPVVDGLANDPTPPVADHDPVSVTLGGTHASIDATIMPGGYIGLHADGPHYPTGAVYSDVMYQVGSTWAEVDSGFSTGGTFEKLWKVLPTGHYRLDYSDYFGRGAGSWEFDLAGYEHKYASIVVPMPLTAMSISTGVSGSFDGLLDGGLQNGGVGSAKLNVDKLASLPSTAPPPPSNYISGGGIYGISLAGTSTANGVWTLTLPYSPSVPNNLVGNLQVRHIKQDGTAEMLMPFRWNTANHTLQVQTTSLSPFQVMFHRTKVTLSKPSVPSKISRNTRFVVTGLLTPSHSAGASTSVRMYVYKYSSSKHRYLLVSKPWAKNANYRGATRYSLSLKLGRGKYRLTPVAPADTWHLATTGPYTAITIK